MPKIKLNHLLVLSFIFLLLSLVFFVVGGCNTGGSSSSGSSVSAPAAPSGLSLRAISSTTIILSWNDNSNDEVGFKVEAIITPSTTYALLATLAANTAVYTHTGLTATTTYSYRVQAYNYVGVSAYSNAVSATTQQTGITLDNWSPITTTGAPSARIGHTAISVTGVGMIVYGGSDFLQNGFVYSPTANTWTAINTTGVPSARVGHTAVWTGTEMLVWGGERQVSVAIAWTPELTPTLYGLTLNDGARYDPTTNTWAPITALNAPGDRVNHTVIWTGTRMIVWGGERITEGADSSGNRTGVKTRTKLNTGGVYDPATNTWSPYQPNLNSGFGAPTSRRFHSCVWIGGVMIVWGGDGGSNTGGMYSPTTDFWITEPIATLNAPSARYSHSTIWTGSGSESWRNKMIVWGGTNSEAYFNTGGIYDPISNTWTALPTLNAPSGRVYHSAVWTGTRMIVWGGGAGVLEGAFNTGAIYNPARNVWEPITSTGAPIARTRHTAVWYINKLLIWGGWDALTTFNDGGAYTTD